MTQPKSNQNKEALGKGIRSLLQSIDADLKTGSGQLKPTVVETATGSFRNPLDEIDINPKQPRRYFDEEALNELASSIKSHDIIQPVTVSKMPSGRYRLVSGERRLRASKLAGLKDIPAYIRQTNDQQLLELAFA
jgi:ParB family chromosome partitioning protein